MGQRIAFTSLRTGVQRIYVYNLTTHHCLKSQGTNVEDGQPAWSPREPACIRKNVVLSQIWSSPTTDRLNSILS